MASFFSHINILRGLLNRIEFLHSEDHLRRRRFVLFLFRRLITVFVLSRTSISTLSCTLNMWFFRFSLAFAEKQKRQHLSQYFMFPLSFSSSSPLVFFYVFLFSDTSKRPRSQHVYRFSLCSLRRFIFCLLFLKSWFFFAIEKFWILFVWTYFFDFCVIESFSYVQKILCKQK